MKPLSLARALTAALMGIFPIASTAAPIDYWTIGGSHGQQWSEWSNLNILVDFNSVPGSLQALELRPDRNIVPLIYAAHQWELYQSPPNPLWVPGVPRMWRGFGKFGPMTPIRPIAKFIDGDLTTFGWATNYGPGGNKTAEEFYTLAPGGPLPLERWILQLPPPHMTDLFGEPWTHYASRQGELSGALQNGEAQSQREFLNDQSHIAQEYQPLETLLGEVQDNREAPIEIDFPLQYLSHIRWKSFPDDIGGGGQTAARVPMIRKLAYAEFELYGRGFAGASRFESQVIDLGQPVILGEVALGTSKWRRQGARWIETSDEAGEGMQRRWEEGQLVEAPAANAEVFVRFKSGTTNDPRQFFTYGDIGELVEVDFSTWQTLEKRLQSHYSPANMGNFPGWQGPVAEDRKNWTPWSGRINTSETRLALTSGRYFQILVEMGSGTPTDVARLDSISVQLLPLLVPTLVGEIGLDADAESTSLPQAFPGKPTELTYAIRASFEGRASNGFDALHIATPAQPELLYLHLGNPPEEIALAADQIHADAHGITLYLPALIDQDTEIRIGLRTALYTLSTKLEGEVFERRANAARQVIVEGNATDEIGSDKLQLISGGTIPETIADLRIEPPILTPNGDGRNDYAQISFTLFGVLDARIDITFYNLSGEPVRQLKALHQKAGLNAALAWDGRDASGELVSPGLYLCAVKTATSRGDFVVSRPIALAY